MKNKRFRLISLVLVLVLALQFALVAAASGDDNSQGTVSWRDAQGYLKYAVVTKTGFTNREVRVEPAAVAHEGYGFETYFISGNYPVYDNVDFNFPAAYESYLYQAAASVGVQETFYETVYLSANGVFVPDYEEFGTYCPTVTIHGHICTYRVETVRETGNVTEVASTIPFAPYACSGVMTDYVAW